MIRLGKKAFRSVFVKSVHCMIGLLIFTLCLPLSFMSAGPGKAAPVFAGEAEPWNRHVHERLNSPERQAAIQEAARLDAAMREAGARSEAAAPAASLPREKKAASLPPPASGKSASAEALRPQSVTEVLFNYAAGFAGVPGLAPRRGADGSSDEGLGFHQDGTARKAGGVTGASGPSSNGYRARTYMQSGMGLHGQGQGQGQGNGPHGDRHGDFFGRNDPARGGRVSSSGSYGGGYSRSLSDFDPMSMALERGLSWGAGLVNSMGEAALSGLVDGGRARLNFMLDRDGYFSGEGDALLPFHDSVRTTVYTQIGARSMHDSSDTRWIGNFGLGQRWFPFAQGEDLKSADYDAGNLMLGYNAFFDYDLTRDHRRGGFGAELQYDWLRLASNYYFPLSGWKGSEDFDSAFVKERAAEGWDARLKAHLPFYRNVALTGAYSQWYGDNVGMFGADSLEKDPRVWSYGIEYTPVPLLSGFLTQRSTERGRTDTEFGLNFTYHFQMPWEEQISHSRVAELRTVGGGRHEFVDRENRIILEYKGKNSGNVVYLGRAGLNTFRFRLVDGLGKYQAGQTVRVSAGNGVMLAEASGAAPGDTRAAPEKSLLARAGEAIVDFFSVSVAHASDIFTGEVIKITNAQGVFLVEVVSERPTVALNFQLADGRTQTVTLGEVYTEGIIITPLPQVGSSTVPDRNSPISRSYSVHYDNSGKPGLPVPDGTRVRLLAQTQGGKGAAQLLEVASGTTTNGQVEFSYAGQSGSRQDNSAFLARKVKLYATCFGATSAPGGDIAVGSLPGSDFLTGVSASTMDWRTATNYCAAHGGQLPGNKIYSGAFPDGRYWTRQASGEHAYILVGGSGGLTALSTVDSQSSPNRVVCVP